jgi:hypothetical protein
MDEEIERTINSLVSRRFCAVFAENAVDAKNKILDLIPKNALVGVGDSTTVAQIGVKEELKKRGTKMLDAFDRERVYVNLRDYEERHFKMIKDSTICDVFLTGTNAVTRDGRLVNVDGSGNRVAGMFWGPRASIIVVGSNKIVKDLDEAFHRIRTIIAPNHISIGLVGLADRRYESPCAATGVCSDCRSRDRICNVFTIIEGKPDQIDMTVIIVKEDLGLGWDESWPRERIDKIIEKYKRFAFYSVRGALLRKEAPADLHH